MLLLHDPTGGVFPDRSPEQRELFQRFHQFCVPFYCGLLDGFLRKAVHLEEHNLEQTVDIEHNNHGCFDKLPGSYRQLSYQLSQWKTLFDSGRVFYLSK